ncbi:patatin-like phospholipase domain-containing protein 2 isoform X3 [Kryptolebias marmoratus]|uniref:patatin-like phospholipase domain-containing protein 2 isoform X3 n=1 Tax=Kryptolebias marmoratus TaxID=37003 RepID=UPI0007F86D5A|nr:patatin-like phospholipase domain-containing protein 2 isoform X3 [Kryptolebias marmoratus]
MFNWAEEWHMSFAGCGFRSMYYVGALSCILERVPQLVHGASTFGGASSGCLVAAALAVGIPIEKLCFMILITAKEARKHNLGVFHPTFSLLRVVQRSLLEMLPEDAHLRATGRLCVSLTQLNDGRNVLVSEFASREELIQVLMCSCFFPVYCGFIPPAYRGVRYMDGALSNNMPLFEHRNTITLSPFSGESDICPTEGTFNFFEAHYGNKLAEICHNGYMDALRFLRDRDLVGAECNPRRVALGDKFPCCEPVREMAKTEDWKRMKIPLNNGGKPQEHQMLDQRIMENLPMGIKKVLCGVCRDSYDAGSWWSLLANILPVKLQTLLLMPFNMSLLLLKRLRSELQTLSGRSRPRQASHTKSHRL